MPASPKSPFAFLAQRPGIVAGGGLLVVVLAPFVFFPEIMGDAGVTHAGALRNGVALTAISLGSAAFVSGLSMLVWRRFKGGSKRG